MTKKNATKKAARARQEAHGGKYEHHYRQVVRPEPAAHTAPDVAAVGMGDTVTFDGLWEIQTRLEKLTADDPAYGGAAAAFLAYGRRLSDIALGPTHGEPLDTKRFRLRAMIGRGAPVPVALRTQGDWEEAMRRATGNPGSGARLDPLKTVSFTIEVAPARITEIECADFGPTEANAIHINDRIAFELLRAFVGDEPFLIVTDRGHEFQECRLSEHPLWLRFATRVETEFLRQLRALENARQRYSLIGSELTLASTSRDITDPEFADHRVAGSRLVGAIQRLKDVARTGPQRRLAEQVDKQQGHLVRMNEQIRAATLAVLRSSLGGSA